MPPSILCVVLDTARADALEPYGAPSGSTPVIAQLAKSGRSLPSVYATAPWTLPSHASMFTGLLPSAVRVGETGEEREDAAASLRSHRTRMLPEVLRRAGYDTGAVSTNVWVSNWTGFDIGFNRFRMADTGRHGAIHAKGRRARIRWMREAVRARVDDGAAEAERALVEWIAEVEPGRPFFWFVNLMECHSPYLPPRPYNDLGSLDRLRAGLEAQRHLTLDAIWRTCLGVAQVPDAALERMRHLYTRSIRYMDDWLGRVLERLETRGALADTMVLVTSDHGENFGDGGLIAHGFSLDDRLLHVPLVATGPGSEALPDRLVSLGELPRMLAGAAGIPDHPWDDDDLPPAGIAVAQLNPPLEPENPDLKTMQREWGLERTGIDRLTARFECATDGRLKLVRGEGRELLYDLEADPLELAPHPVEGSPTTSTASSTAIAALRRAIDHPAARPRSGADAEAVQTPTDEETAAIEERMRLLGYL